MKRLAPLLGLAALIVACDSGGPTPPAESVTYAATITGPLPVGAVLLSIEGTPEEVTVRGGYAVITEDAGRTVVAAVVASPASRLEVDVVVSGAAPDIEVLQVSGLVNQLYDDPSSFTVAVEERVDG